MTTTPTIDWFDVTTEKWARHPEFPRKYAVSTYGRVYSIPNCRLCMLHLRLQFHKRHPMVSFNGSTIPVKVIMGRTFPLPRLETQTHIYHLDGDSTNNMLTNLAWCEPAKHVDYDEWTPWTTLPNPEPYTLPYAIPVAARRLPSVPPVKLVSAPYGTMVDGERNVVVHLGRFESDQEVQEVLALVYRVLDDEKAKRDPVAVYLRDDME